MQHQNHGERTLPIRMLFLSACVRGGGAGWSLYCLLTHLDRDKVEPLVVPPARGISDGRCDALRLRVHVSAHVPERTKQQRFKRNARATAMAGVLLNLRDSARLIPELVRVFDMKYSWSAAS